jgi:type III secretion system FlhB-like substrate exporter
VEAVFALVVAVSQDNPKEKVRNARPLRRINLVILNRVEEEEWIVKLVIGELGAIALRPVEVALDTALDLSQDNQVVEVLPALRLTTVNHAILKIVPWIVKLVIGKHGEIAPRDAAVALENALDLSQDNQVVEVLPALRLRTVNHAILKVVELIVVWVSGKLGAVAPRDVVAVCNLEPAGLPLLLLVMVPLVLRLRTQLHATHNHVTKRVAEGRCESLSVKFSEYSEFLLLVN